MYQNILVALENSRADQSLLSHIEKLATLLRARLLLVHVADGWVARHFERLKLAESEEMKADRHYLETTAEKLRAAGLQVTTRLALGDPPVEILNIATAENCDLI
ncbi:MAG TPA: universal stress protein, partial [Verrucomicrobiae bacterium]|nr:universal stress protein [Verrucomicrobiae bacterium]